MILLAGTLKRHPYGNGLCGDRKRFFLWMEMLKSRRIDCRFELVQLLFSY
jgi:hypothetical protein